jgi:predicted phosphodiesterase
VAEDPRAEVAFEERLEAEIQRETRDLRRERDAAIAETKEIRDLLGFYQRVEAAAVAPPAWTRKPRAAKGSRGIVAAQLTDTHFDEVVRPEEVLYINAYDRRIAELRLRRWTDKVRELPRDYVAGIGLDGVVVLATGDLMSGDIHAELKQSNEDHLYASVVHWYELLISALRALADEYGAVHVYAVVGNHGRSTVKPVFKGRAHSNIEWLMWRMIQGRLAGDARLSFSVSDSMDLPLKLYGRNLVLTHGDQFHGGTGISAALAPLMLGQNRKNLRQMAAGMPMDLMVMGHFHQLLDLPGVIVGGSMKGYDEFAFGLNLRPEEPKQALWIETPEHGKSVTIPVFVSDRKAEGW